MSITPPLMRPPPPEKQPASYSLPSSFPPSPIAHRRASLPTPQVESTLTPTRSISMPTPSPSPPSVTHSSSHSTPSRSRRARPTKSFVRVTPIEIARRVGRTMSRHDGKPANMRVHRSITGEPVLTVPEFSWKHGQRSRGASLCCDGVFDGECDDELFQTVGAPLVESALKGGSSCIVAYGQSGTGKSYTLWRVMIPAVADALFEAGAVVTVGAQQIYFDRVEDIMPQPSQVSSRRGSVTSRESDSTPRRRSLPERAAPSSSEPRVVLCNSAEQMKNILASAAERIRTGRTMLNQSSSRSHTVVHLQVELGGETGNLALVDLAGSERLKKSGSKGVMQQEAIAINSSLHALSQVIEAVGRRKAHIPTRVCNLTQLLDRYVRGGDLLHLLVCVSPLRDHISETIHSLQFAQSAMRVQDVEVVPDEPSPEEMRRGRISVVEGGHVLGDGAYWVLASPTSGPGSFRGAHAHSVEASPPMTPPISGYSTPRWIANMRSGETAPTSVGSGVHDMVTSPLHAQLHMEQLLERFHEEHFTISELERSLESEKARLARYKYRSRRYRAELKLLKQLVGVREPAEAAGSASSGASTPFDTEDSGGDEPPRREGTPMDMHEWWDSFGSEYEAAVEGEALKPPRRLFAVEETWDEGAEEKGGWERREEEGEVCVAGAIDQAVALRAEELRAGRRRLPPSLDGRLSEELLASIGAARERSEKSSSDRGEADESSEESWMASSEASSEASSAVLMAALVHPSPREGGARAEWGDGAGAVLAGEGGGGAQAEEDGGAAAPPAEGGACAEGSALWLTDGGAVPPTPTELAEIEIGSGAPPPRKAADDSAALSDCSDGSQPRSEERADHALATVDGGGVEAQAHAERFAAEAAALPAEPIASKAQSAEADSLSRRDTPTGPSCDGAEASAPLDEGSGGKRAAEEWCVVQEGGRDEAGLPSVGEECHAVSAGAAAPHAEERHAAFAYRNSDGEESQLALRGAAAEERSSVDAYLSSNSEECQAAVSDAEPRPADSQDAYEACLSSESEEECQVAVSDAIAIAAEENNADDSCPSSDSEECQVAAVATPAEELSDDVCLSSDSEDKCQVAVVVTPAEKPSAYDVCPSSNGGEERHTAIADAEAFTVEGSIDALACLPSDSDECQVGVTVAVATSVEGDDASYACLPASKEDWHVAAVAVPAEKHNTDNACPSPDSGECQAVVGDAVTTPAEAPDASYTCLSASNEEWRVPAVATHVEKQNADDACASSDSGERQAAVIDAVTTPSEAATASYACLASDCEECQAAPEEEQYAHDACPSSDGEERQVAVSDAVAAPVEERNAYDAILASGIEEYQAAVSDAVATPEEEHSAYDACLSSASEECQAAVSDAEDIAEEDNGEYDVLHTTPEQAGRGSSMARHAVEERSSEEKLNLDEASPSSGKDACQAAATVDDPTPAVEQEAVDAAYITPERAGGNGEAVLAVTPPVLQTQAALSVSPSDWHARGENHKSADATEPIDAASPLKAQESDACPSGGAREEAGMAQCEKLASTKRPTLSLLLWLGFIALSLLLTHALVHSRAEPSDFPSPGRSAEGEGEAPRWASYPECSEGDSCELRQEHVTLGRREQSFHGPSTSPRKGSADTRETFRFAAIHTNMLADNDRLAGVAMPKGDRAGATASDDEEALPALSVRTVELVSLWEGETRLTRMVGDGTREDRSTPRRNAVGPEWHTHIALPCGEHLFRYRVTTCKPGLLWLLPDCSTKEYHDPAEPTRMVDDKAVPQDTPPYSWRTFWRLLQDALFSFKLRKQSSFEGTWNVRLVDCHDRAL